ncbi:REn [Juncus maritimus associated virus]|uniref:Replication enhancer n=1 Tax=Juncus maritimus associated virus TaxID=2093273 RepID=A0A2I8B2J7_9GEMI|nr:REn [Juncus maritimus associated virus]AUT11868.1 REn [Juncus maritimus associated virus]
MDSRTGDTITAHQANSGIWFDELKNPINVNIDKDWDIFPTFNKGFQVTVKFNHNLRKALGLHKCWITFKIWTTLKSFGKKSLEHRIRFHLMSFLDSCGVISINLMIRAINKLIAKCLWIVNIEEQRNIVMFNIY